MTPPRRRTERRLTSASAGSAGGRAAKLLRRPILITGGAGFIGSNIADALAARGEQVLVLDNFARTGAEENAEWLRSRHPGRITIERADIRNPVSIDSAVRRAGAVIHLAAQVAVTTSVESPSEDFEINARATVGLLELLRRRNPDAPLLFASTNKVYGKLFDRAQVVLRNGRHEPTDGRYVFGVDESTPLDLYSPYGCSKGAADQYVRDYARVYGLRTVVLRMSCVYGPRQFGTEDQGWLAHFLIRAIRGEPITVYGDGRQVRDVLYIDDAVDAWLRVLDRIDRTAGLIFNLGGGPQNAVSLLEAIDLIGTRRAKRPALRFEPERPGDQPWYVSNTAALDAAIEWRPRTAVQPGLQRLADWLEQRFGRAGARHVEIKEATA